MPIYNKQILTLHQRSNKIVKSTDLAKSNVSQRKVISQQQVRPLPNNGQSPNHT